MYPKSWKNWWTSLGRNWRYSHDKRWWRNAKGTKTEHTQFKRCRADVKHTLAKLSLIICLVFTYQSKASSIHDEFLSHQWPHLWKNPTNEILFFSSSFFFFWGGGGKGEGGGASTPHMHMEEIDETASSCITLYVTIFKECIHHTFGRDTYKSI